MRDSLEKKQGPYKGQFRQKQGPYEGQFRQKQGPCEGQFRPGKLNIWTELLTNSLT